MIKEGDSVRLVETRDIFTKLRKGDLGIVKDVTFLPESIGASMQVWIRWDSCSNLALIDGIDRWG